MANLVGFVVGPAGMKLLASRMLSPESKYHQFSNTEILILFVLGLAHVHFGQLDMCFLLNSPLTQ